MKKIIQFLVFIFITIPGFSQHEKSVNLLWAVKIDNSNFSNLHKVNDSLYRSEQPSKKGYAFLEKLHIRSVLSLYPNSEDETLTEKLPFQTYRVKMYSDDFSNKDVAMALYIIQMSPKPLLVHCKHGSDRTGLIIAMYRIIIEHWTKKMAIDEMRHGDFGFDPAYKNIVQYIRDVHLDKIRARLFALQKID